MNCLFSIGKFCVVSSSLITFNRQQPRTVRTNAAFSFRTLSVYFFVWVFVFRLAHFLRISALCSLLSFAPVFLPRLRAPSFFSKIYLAFYRETNFPSPSSSAFFSLPQFGAIPPSNGGNVAMRQKRRAARKRSVANQAAFAKI